MPAEIEVDTLSLRVSVPGFLLRRSCDAKVSRRVLARMASILEDSATLLYTVRMVMAFMVGLLTPIKTAASAAL